ncbi:MAG: pantoate--beta-alanine ligase [Sedimentisphaerales bacterium]|nr:pantoate--beta-alanine ligase [Sedimentisphaerales bacterium]
MDVAQTIAQVRGAVAVARKKGSVIGLVPTMGALHQGHVSLIKAARADCGYVVVSIFVNPTQFGPGEDFDRYPRPIDQDLEVCRHEGVDLVFAPTIEEMYGEGTLTWVQVDRLTDTLCGRFRPGHFRGVTTVCTKLFNIVQPDRAYFGQKDAQQAVVIQRMVADLNMPLEIVVCPTIREPDGLAASSRNQYLTSDQRSQAPILYKALRRGQEVIEAGLRDPAKVVQQIRHVLDQAPDIRVQYISIVDPQTLEPVDRIVGKVLIAAAVYLGQTRLIDNILLDLDR